MGSTRETPTERILQFPSGTDNSRFTSTSEEESTDGSEGEDSDARVRDYQQEFSSLLADVNSAIEELGGKVAPKLNWSAPLDAVWMLPGRSLKCENADEVVMLLKSSDRVAHDICHAFDHCPGGPSLPRPDFFLALRKWYDLRPEGEFRAFVRSQELVGASQRDVSQPFAMAAGQRATVRELLLEFHKSHIQNVFPLGDCE
ncbi:unnamed protein product [Ostreobium quekettii]|uniref:Cell division cycle protein 123 n=1 Tax=Ostreobium quekettii TaxID=121088 RepID=A0A8S1J2U0_9CHLO|nr:unnamed protein product [Ostreobium quekettii]|eukprot:evm.model.scf_102.1 EVM.evm.TU.scf_102.1   scf_102:28820-30240(-)